MSIKVMELNWICNCLLAKESQIKKYKQKISGYKLKKYEWQLKEFVCEQATG